MAAMLLNRHTRRLAAALLTIAMFAAACTSDGGDEPPQTAPTSPGDEGPSLDDASVLFLDDRTLMRYDVATGETERLIQLPSAEVAVSPDGTRYVVVEKAAPDGGATQPRLRLGAVDGPETTTDIGPGAAPHWSPDGERVAAVVGDIGFICGPRARIRRGDDPPKGCVPAEQIVSFPADESAGEATIVLGPNKSWSLLGITDGNRVTGAGGDGGVVISAPEGQGEPVPLGFESSEIWGVSPTELKLLIAQKDATFFTVPGAGAAAPLELGGAELGDGTWSPDGGRVAAVLHKGGAADDPLGIVDAATNEVQDVPGSEGARGNVVWSQGGLFAYVRADGDTSQVCLCPDDFLCRELFTLPRGGTLLAVEEGSPG